MPLADIPDDAIEALLDASFGPDRHLRTAYRIRAGTRAIPALSFAAVEGPQLLGSIQCWPIALHPDDGGEPHLLTMIGPVAVQPARQRSGIGRQLMAHALGAAEGLEEGRALMLIGDPEYYGRFFGFDAAHTGLWRAPGPIDRHRLLARGVAVPTGPGMLGPAGVIPPIDAIA